MGVELSTWRPLWEFSAILLVLGAASGVSSRDRMSWWLSQGLLLLGMILGFAAIGAMHPRVDLFSLSVWAPLVLVLEWAVVAMPCAGRTLRPARTNGPDDKVDSET